MLHFVNYALADIALTCTPSDPHITKIFIDNKIIPQEKRCVWSVTECAFASGMFTGWKMHLVFHLAGYVSFFVWICERRVTRHVRVRTHMHTRPHEHTLTHTHTLILTHTHTHTCAHTHTHTHTCTHTHTHTHTLKHLLTHTARQNIRLVTVQLFYHLCTWWSMSTRSSNTHFY